MGDTLELVWGFTLPDDLEEVITCQLCGQPMQLLKLNEHVAWWIHRGEQLKTCTKLAFRTSYLKYLSTFMRAKMEKLRLQVRDEEDGGSSDS